MNKFLKTLLCATLCIASALPSFAEMQITKEEGVIIAMDEQFFYSTEMLNSQSEISQRKSALGVESLWTDGQSAVMFMIGCGINHSKDFSDIIFGFVGPDSWYSQIRQNKAFTITFTDGKVRNVFIPEFDGAIQIEDYVLSTGFVPGATDGSSIAGKLPMNEAMIQFATSNIASIKCGNQTYHFKGNTAEVIRAEFDALFKQKEVSKEAFSIYLNSVDAKAASTASASKPASTSSASRSTKTPKTTSSSSAKPATATAAKPSARASEYSSDVASLIKNPAGYTARNPFKSPGIYEDNFKAYASGNSWRYRTRSAGQNQVLVFDNGTVSSTLMGYECKFVANFKNQILNGYAYQTQVISSEQAVKLANELASGLSGLSNVAPASDTEADSGTLFSRQYLYGAGTKLTVDARQVDGRYFVSLTVGITHF
ncbi:MAG: hypothetical protein NC127_01780 [Muribaculum sp.]|nr:hypothetical protein [Muribaculum sp.]